MEYKLRIYLDSNFFIALLEKYKNYEIYEEILDWVKNGKIEAFTSWYTISEAIGYLKGKYEKKHKLRPTTRIKGRSKKFPENFPEKIPDNVKKEMYNSILKYTKIPNLTTISLPEVEFSKIPEKVTNLCIHTDDAPHLIAAQLLKINFLVTNDEIFRERCPTEVGAISPEKFYEDNKEEFSL